MTNLKYRETLIETVEQIVSIESQVMTLAINILMINELK